MNHGRKCEFLSWSVWVYMKVCEKLCLCVCVWVCVCVCVCVWVHGKVCEKLCEKLCVTRLCITCECLNFSRYKKYLSQIHTHYHSLICPYVYTLLSIFLGEYSGQNWPRNFWIFGGISRVRRVIPKDGNLSVCRCSKRWKHNHGLWTLMQRSL